MVAAADAPCQTLVTPGALPECREVVMAGNRVVWMIERTTAAGATAHRVRILTFSSDAGGWVEWLRADDPTGERWVEVNVLAADLTADGTAELLVGFRGADERETLEYDVVGSGLDGVPTVLAHPDPPQRGAVVLVAGSIHEYAAVYPGGEPACCPPSFVRRVVDFEDGLFRVTSADSVPPNAVPSRSCRGFGGLKERARTRERWPPGGRGGRWERVRTWYAGRPKAGIASPPHSTGCPRSSSSGRV